MIRIAILGSTGSIGQSALAVVAAHPDRLRVVVLAAGTNTERLVQQVAAVQPEAVAVATEAARADLRARLDGDAVRILPAGADGLLAAATYPGVDIVLCASSGTAGLEAALAAIGEGRTLALANKEVLVMAGRLMVDAARRRGTAILPVDSEHNAIHQCLDGRQPGDVKRLILTASGGPFRSMDAAALERVTPDDALRHPTWRMGRKITIDSATLMNKGLEVIEARWLFDVTADRIAVVVHPQSVVHSMVEFCDGSILAQLGVTDMRLPIQYAFSYPARWTAPVPPLDITRAGTLEFHPPDLDRFPSLRLAYGALEHGGAWPVVLNAANEVAVAAFLEGRLRFVAIPQVIERALLAADHELGAPATLAEVRTADAWARAFSTAVVGTLPST
ncbi:MAG: 1-deoxy-D-xylulose-5-phosphate reductoisomerase [Acidobacteria bacterium SCN 69-37]|nr:MAG: 1-deoxy-D-xylulose-5-phosphate reductoisomerase [Acidobacteria bacterium SCN 69-37]